MCVKPVSIVVSDRPQEIACRQCWQCRKERVEDYVGRCLAESVTSVGVSVLTLTYAGDVPGSVLLLMSDVQRLWKRLRKGGFPLRYIIAGEHGSRLGRAHWHAVIFWQSKVPPGLPQSGFGHWKFWPHGHVHVGRFDQAWLRYQLKYILKDYGQSVQVSRLAMSKKPPLGHAYFMARADELVYRKQAPVSFLYRFPGSFDRKGRAVDFRLQGRMAELFLDRWQVQWRLAYNEPAPWPVWLAEKYFDPIERRQKELRDVASAFRGEAPSKVCLVDEGEEGAAGADVSSDRAATSSAKPCGGGFRRFQGAPSGPPAL